eukprot:jgi/Orpsp1_1/1181763/evm.model.c7180000078497.1
MWISPLNCENLNSWETLKVNELFVLQKSVAQVGLFWKTLQNVFDTKQPPFRIVFKSSQNELGQVIAVGNTKEEIDKDWKYIIDNFMPAVEQYDDFNDKESFVLYKLGFLLSSDGDEVDGYDETILPVDYKKSGQIVDDEMNAIMVRPLPEGVRLTAIFDSCHSGTALDLPYVYADDGSLVVQKGPSTMKMLNDTINSFATGDVLGIINNVMNFAESDKIKKNSAKANKKTKETKSTFADVIMFSGCKDDQTSADTKINNRSTGAMSYAFIRTVMTNQNLTYLQLLQKTKAILREKYSQKPQLSSGRLMDMNQIFY